MSDKFCVNCKWAVGEMWCGKERFDCTNPRSAGYDLVTGEVNKSSCEFQRSEEWFAFGTRCKPKGRFFEPKDKPQ